MTDRGDRRDVPKWDDAQLGDSESQRGREVRKGSGGASSSDEREARPVGERVSRGGSTRTSSRSSQSRGGESKSSGSGAGLYGSDIGSNMLRAGVAEVVGTFILVFTGTSVAIAAAQDIPIVGAAYDSLAIALAFGLVLVALVAALGHVSGAHLNPAVTIGLASIGKFPWNYVPAYVGAQVLGAILAAFSTWITFGSVARSEASLAAPGIPPDASLLQGFFIEAIITFILVFVIVSVATDDRVPAAIAPVAVGFALAAAVFIGGPVTGGSVNPARALGPMLVSLDRLELSPIYIIAPIVGGVLAALLYDKFISDAEEPEE